MVGPRPPSTDAPSSGGEPEPISLPDPRCGRIREVDLGGLLLSAFHLRPGFHLGFHRHASSALFVWLDGTLRVDLGRGGWTLSETGEVLVLPAGLEHREYAGDDGGRCLMIRAVPDSREEGELEEILGGETGGVVALEGVPPVLGAALEEEQGTALRLRARAACLSLVGEIGSLFPGQGRFSAPPWLRRIRAHLDRAFSSPWSLDELADRAGVSSAHLARSFRECYGRTVGDHVRELRLEAAAHRLREGGRPISQVADELGFSDQSHLTRLFRKRFGLTPARYRRRESA